MANYNKINVLVLAVTLLGAVGCVSEEADPGDGVSTVGQASTGNSPDYVYLSQSTGRGYRGWSSVVHKYECFDNPSSSGYYDTTYQGWSNTNHCANVGHYYSHCSGSGVTNHNTNHFDSVDHVFNYPGASHDAADAHHENGCSYSWLSTCNSKDWMEHFVDCGQPYWEDAHGSDC